MAFEFGAAEEVQPNVLHVWRIDDGEPDRDPRPYELRITRTQLRSVAHASVNIFDDSQGSVSVAAENPVHAGVDAFAFYTQESMDSGDSGKGRTYEFLGGEMRLVNRH